MRQKGTRSFGCFMIFLNFVQIFALVTGGLVATGVSLFAVIWLERRRMSVKSAKLAFDPTSPEKCFLFENESLVDCSAPGRQMLASLARDRAERGTEWQLLLAALDREFPGASVALCGLRDSRPVTLTHDTATDSLALRASVWHGLVFVHVGRSRPHDMIVSVPRQEYADLKRDRDRLRETLSACPVPIWNENPGDGTIQWANDAYGTLLRRDGERAYQWPLPRIFDAAPDIDAPLRVRLSASDDGGASGDLWFDHHRRALDNTTMNFAIPVTEAVRADAALRRFVETLTKTFAHLATGLAVFDARRELVLFNPALSELTTLDAAWLAGRPSLTGFLDRLRDLQRIAEPKDYRAWRQTMSTLEENAARGTYEETWSLSNGQTFRVTGRPHPEGAIAFLFEDITQQMQRSRNLRAGLELSHSILDGLEDAVAVFSSVGQLIFSNEAYDLLWGVSDSASADAGSIITATRHWSGCCQPTPVWGDLRDFVLLRSGRTVWRGDVRQRDDAPLSLVVTPIAGGHTMVRFATRRVVHADPPPRIAAVPDGLSPAVPAKIAL